MALSGSGSCAWRMVWAASALTFGPISPSRPLTRWTWVSTGRAGRAGEQQHAGRRLRADAGQVLQPGVCFRQRQIVRKLRSNCPRSALIWRSTFWTRGAFCSGQVVPSIAASTSASGASRTAAQSGKRARNALKPPRSAGRRCDATATPHQAAERVENRPARLAVLFPQQGRYRPRLRRKGWWRPRPRPRLVRGQCRRDGAGVRRGPLSRCLISRWGIGALRHRFVRMKTSRAANMTKEEVRGRRYEVGGMRFER